ncbi:MAG: hypothetical protein U1A78_16000 [Polyangia bacterium]
MGWSSKQRRFGVDSPVLSFLKRYPGYGKPKRYLLWPAWRYRVVVPMERRQLLNVLQRAVLGLGVAGLRRPSDIATRLHLSLELVEYILTELRSLHLIDKKGTPTEQGRAALDDAALTPTELRVLNVFQDPWTRDLWPRCVERLEYPMLDRSRGPFPALQLGTTGKSRVESAFWHLPPGNVEPTPPLPMEILTATRRHRQAIRIAEGKEAAPPETEEGDDEHLAADDETVEESWTVPSVPTTLAVSGVERVTCIDQEPQAVFLVTYLCPTTDEGSEYGWEAADPFGFGASAKLRRTILKQIDRSELLRKQLDELLGNELGRQLEINDQFQRMLRAKAELEVTGVLYDEVRGWSGWEDLLEMAMGRIELEQTQAGRRDPVSRRTLSAGRRLLERLFGELRERHPAPVWEQLHVRGARGWMPQTDPGFVRGCYDAAARRIGLQTPLPDALLSIKPGDVRSAVVYAEAWRLRPRIVASLLCAAVVPEHPLAGVARGEPSFLHAVERVVERTHAAAHVGVLNIRAQEVTDIVREIYRIVGLLRGSPR